MMEGRRLNEFLRSTVGARGEEEEEEEEEEKREEERPALLVLMLGGEEAPSMVAEVPLLR
jgi:hypothetical protein